MPKIDVFCLIRKRPMKVDKRLGDALVKMKRAQYINSPAEAGYKTRMLAADKPEAKLPAAPPLVDDLVDAPAEETAAEDIVADFDDLIGDEPEAKPKKKPAKSKKVEELD